MKKFMTLAVAMVLFLGLGMFNIAAALEMTGTYYIGAIGTGPGGTNPEYGTLKAACDALNAATITGDVTMYITSDLSEPENVAIGKDPSPFKVVFKPYTDKVVTITFTKTADNAGLSGAWVIGVPNVTTTSATNYGTVPTRNITIDGSNLADGTTRDLTITNTATSHINTNIVKIFGDANNITLKNCKVIQAISSTNTGSNYGISVIHRYHSTNTSYYTPDSITVENCEITSTGSPSAQGLAVSNSGTFPGTGPYPVPTAIVFRNNKITAKTRGIFLNWAGFTDVYNNEINVQQTGSGFMSYGIWGLTISSSTCIENIYNNKITLLSTFNSSSTGDYGIVGIECGSLATYNVYNNFITGFATTTTASNPTSKIFGVRLQGSLTTTNLFHNTIQMDNLSIVPGSGVVTYAGIYVKNGTNKIFNNIVTNKEDDFKSYAFYRDGTAGTLTTDFNDYYLTGTTNAKLGSWNGMDAKTLADWQIASGQDAHSVSKAVEFTGTTDLHLAGASIGDNGLAGLPIASVAEDIDGDVRSVFYPYMGADENTTPLFGTAPKVFFSEYIEGSASNKAIEIYNATGADIDLSKYSVKLSSNGLGWGTPETLSGTLAAGDVYVIANASASAPILGVSDITSTVTYYNGNDAVGLSYGTVLIDAIGAETVTTNFDVAGIAGAALDHTLIRKSSVIKGNTNWTASAGANADDSEWIVKAKDTFGYLGSHNLKPLFTMLTLAVSADSANWVAVAGNQTDGFDLTLNPNIIHYYLNIDATTQANTPLKEGRYGFTFASSPTGFLGYWAGRGVDANDVGATGDTAWQAVQWEIINGRQPAFYLKVNADGSLMQVDGLGFLTGKGDLWYRFESSIPSGNYTYSGKIVSGVDIESATITIPIKIFKSKPEFIDLVLGWSTDQTTWASVLGNITGGYNLALDKAVDYYFDVLPGTATNVALKAGYCGFKIANFPMHFFEYWDSLGIDVNDVGATGDTAWQAIEWEIINGRQPTFYFKVNTDGSKKLVDGLQYQIDQSDRFYKVKGDYPLGSYTYTGKITSTDDVESELISIGITFKPKSDIITIAQLQDTTGNAATGNGKFMGKWIKTTGIVTAVGSNCFWLQDAPGGWNGIYAYTKTAPAVVVGDSILVIGKMAEYYNLTEIDSVTTTVLASGRAIPAPVVVTAAEFAQEKYEGVLVTVNNVTCTNPSLGSGEWEITDATGKTRVNDQLFVTVGKTNWVYNITGVGNYTYSAFKIEPRNAADVVVISSPSSRFLWEKDISSYPFFKNDHNTRGMAYNPATNHLIVASRTGAANVWILNAVNGDTVGRLNMTGVSGGAFAINVPRVDKDGVIYTCNLSTSVSSPFKIYRWANETAVPTVAYENLIPPVARTGDSFGLTGSGVNTILYVSASSSTRIDVLTTTDGATFTAGTPITIAAGLARGGISPVEDGTFWVNGAGTSTSHISATGTVLNAISGGLVDGGWHTVMYLHPPFTKKVVAIAGKNNAFRGNQVQVWNVNESETNPTLVDTVNTTSGYNANTNAVADLAYKLNTDGTATVFELITNNTIAAWTLTLPIDAVSMTVAEAKVDANGDFVPDLAGKSVTLKGIVTSPDYNLTYATAFSYYFQDATGGINLYASTFKDTFQIGDEIEVVGKLQQYRGLTEITPTVVSDIKVISTGNIPTPTKLKVGDIGEATEGQYVQLDSVWLVDVSKWPILGSYATLKITDGVDTTDFFVDNDTDMDGWAKPPSGIFGMYGISSQYTKVVPPNVGYQVIGIDIAHIYYYKEPFKPSALLPFWSKSVNSGNNPPYNTGNSTRGMAAGKMGDKEHVYVVTRNGAHRIVIYDAMNGDSLGVIPAPTTQVGLFPVNVPDVSDDGKLFVCNMTLDASAAPFTVYRWDSETGTPTSVISYTGLNKRFGDMFSVTGKASDNTLTIYAAAASPTVGGTTSDIVKFTTTDNGATFTPTVIDILPTTLNTVPNVQQADDGTLWIKSAGRQLMHRLADGTIDTVASSVVATGSSKIKYMKWKDSERVLVYYYNFSTSTTSERVDVIDVTGGAAKAEKIAFTLPLGNVANSNGTGSVDYTIVNDSTFVLYVFGANNGLAAFTNNSDYVPDNIKVAFYGNTATLHANPYGAGYIAGTNAYGDLGKYEKFDLKANDQLYGFSYFFAAKTIVGTPDTIDLVVRTVGITGAPDVLLAKISVSTDVLDTVLGHFNAFRLPGTIKLAGPVFIGVEWPATCDDQFALYADANGEGEAAHRAWEKYSDGTFGYFDQPGTVTWGLNADLWISTLYIEGPIVGVKKEVVIPTEYALSQNYPNPFNPTTNIALSLPKAAKVSLVVFNLIGQEVATIHKGYLPAGHYTFNFNASNLASGIYFYRVEANNFKSLKKMTILK